MLAIDTNVVVRFLAQDHPEQSAKANRLITSARVFVSLTVMLETEWVLRGVYGYEANRIVKALRAFVGMPHVTVRDAPVLAKALTWTERGMDFADALHLAQAGECEAFVTFDTRLAKAAKRVGAGEARQL